MVKVTDVVQVLRLLPAVHVDEVDEGGIVADV
jgi:hypothetical protein